MFHLGGIGQGARRPCYSRQNRQYAPWYRGSTLVADSNDSFWQIPESAQNFQQVFQQRLKDFYAALTGLGAQVNYCRPKTSGSVTHEHWNEAIDANCSIVVCAGKEDYGKPYALAVLHRSELKTAQGSYDSNLCGKTDKPSPIWIADLDSYQVVTVFGANHNPRKKYLENLRQHANQDKCKQIFPFS